MIRRVSRRARRRIERRRLTRRQQGGGIGTSQEWVAAVTGFINSDEKFRDVLYHIRALASPALLELPPISESDNSSRFQIPSGDIRRVGATIAIVLQEVGIENMTKAEFTDYLANLKRTTENPTIKSSIDFISKIERELTPRDITPDPNFPVYVLALVMNLPENIEPVPILVPPTVSTT
jgi:hypothetical protein